MLKKYKKYEGVVKSLSETLRLELEALAEGNLREAKAQRVNRYSIYEKIEKRRVI